MKDAPTHYNTLHSTHDKVEEERCGYYRVKEVVENQKYISFDLQIHVQRAVQ